MKILVYALSILTIICTINAAKCTISTNLDFGNPQPLLLKPGKNVGNDAFYLPQDGNDQIDFNDEEIILECPGGAVLVSGVSLSKSRASVQCVSGNQFKLTESTEALQFYKFTCSRVPYHVGRFTNKNCIGNHKEVEIGFTLNDKRFLRHVTLCYDSIEQNTLYSQYNLTSSISGFQNGYPRPDDFIQGDFYNIGNHKLTSLYSRYVQRININKLLGLPANSDKYIANTGDFYLARGHLTAKADFVYGAQQISTFYYINVAPQWQTFNGKNWNELENSVRYFASDNNLDLIVYTGTHGVTTLPHEKSKNDVKLYLYLGENGKNGIPVPQLFWKVVYEPITKAGIAFIGVNNPYHTNMENNIICKDICENIKWNIAWNKTSNEEGYSYCCTVDELRRTVKNVPDFEVSSILG